jgi:signal transduction histidine kinase
LKHQEVLHDRGAAPEPHRESAAPEQTPLQPGLAVSPGLLLVVDDDAANRDVLSRRLERQGHRLRTAASGRDVASALAQVGTLAEMEETPPLSDVAAGLPPFAGDEGKLCRTLVNLLANAIKFTHAGTVSVSASQDSAERIRFAIRDTGTGIPTESFDRIFEKFGQLGPGHRVGTGLGLTFCKLAVEAHGGTIEVESMPGVGSTFSFTIPVTHVET